MLALFADLLDERFAFCQRPFGDVRLDVGLLRQGGDGLRLDLRKERIDQNADDKKRQQHGHRTWRRQCRTTMQNGPRRPFVSRKTGFFGTFNCSVLIKVQHTARATSV